MSATPIKLSLFDVIHMIELDSTFMEFLSCFPVDNYKYDNPGILHGEVLQW